MTDTTVIIKTIGRKSLKNAIQSSRREGFKTIVVSDGVKTNADGAHMFLRLGRQWGFYGGMAANVGAAMAETEFITFLDDDDEFILGAGDVIRNSLHHKAAVDVWIGGVRFKAPVVLKDTKTQEIHYDGTDLAIFPEKGLTEGNVAMPTYRTKVFENTPFVNSVPENMQHLTDLLHVQALAAKGYTYDWFGKALYLVRPRVNSLDSKAYNGRGT